VEATVSGSAARAIAEYAASHGVDLIVIGTHGRTGVSRALLGSVAKAVIRRAACRVLTVPAHLEPGVVPPPAAEAEKCVVCARPSDELICEHCPALIRGESLERKLRTSARGTCVGIEPRSGERVLGGASRLGDRERDQRDDGRCGRHRDPEDAAGKTWRSRPSPLPCPRSGPQ